MTLSGCPRCSQAWSRAFTSMSASGGWRWPSPQPAGIKNPGRRPGNSGLPRPDVGDVSAPQLVRLLHRKFSILIIWYIESRSCRLLLSIGRAATDYPECTIRLRSTSPPCSLRSPCTVWLRAELRLWLNKRFTLTCRSTRSASMRQICLRWSEATGTMHIKCWTNQFTGPCSPSWPYQAVRFQPSDIKSALAFFRRHFSRYRRSHRASSSCIRRCSR